MFFLEWLVIVKEEELKESKSKLVKRTDWTGSGPGGRNGRAIKFPDSCLWKISCLQIVSRARLYVVVMDQRKWTQIDVKKKNHLSKMFLWCLSHDLRGDRVSSSGRAVHSGSREVVTPQSSWKTMKAVVCLQSSRRLQLCGSCSPRDLPAHSSQWDRLGQQMNPDWSLQGNGPF